MHKATCRTFLFFSVLLILFVLLSDCANCCLFSSCCTTSEKEGDSRSERTITHPPQREPDLLPQSRGVLTPEEEQRRREERRRIRDKILNRTEKNFGAVLDNTKKCYKGTYEEESTK